MYAQLEDVLTHHFTTRLVPYPDCFTDCFKPGQLNKAIYVTIPDNILPLCVRSFVRACVRACVYVCVRARACVCFDA